VAKDRSKLSRSEWRAEIEAKCDYLRGEQMNLLRAVANLTETMDRVLYMLQMDSASGSGIILPGEENATPDRS